VGLFVSIHFLILSITGSILLLNVSSKSHGTVAAHLSYDVFIKDALTRFPTDRPLALFIDGNNENIIQLRLGKNGSNQFRGARKLSYQATSGQMIQSEDTGTSFYSFVLRIHRELLLGAFGKYYVGFIGILFIFVLLSGGAIYGGFMRGRSYSEIRTQKMSYVYADFHKFIGATVFSWALLVGTTGVFLAFNSILFKMHQDQELGYLKNKYSTPVQHHQIASLDSITSSVLSAVPNSRISYIAFPGTEFSVPGHFLVLIKGLSGFRERVRELVIVDAQSGKFVEHLQLPSYLKLLMLSEPLHFGNYGGLVLKVAWCCFSLLTLGLAISGFTSFVLKREKVNSIYKRVTSNIKIKLISRCRQGSPYFFPILNAVFIVFGIIVSFLSSAIIQWIACVSLLFSVIIVVSVMLIYFKNEKKI
jgi:uncharacterized iron-regulated membrane protein